MAAQVVAKFSAKAVFKAVFTNPCACRLRALWQQWMAAVMTYTSVQLPSMIWLTRYVGCCVALPSSALSAKAAALSLYVKLYMTRLCISSA